ncbi:MAG: hypothetical protein ACWA5W_11440, partial [Phycisphaerales bacterium]
LWTRSNTRIRVMKPIDYTDTGMTNAQIAQDLHQRYDEWTQWQSQAVIETVGREEPVSGVRQIA